MAYDIFPAVDETNKFPPDVRAAMAGSAEFSNLKNAPTPMTGAQRDALLAGQKWDGRTIFNTTTGRLETWSTVSAVWRIVPFVSSTTPAGSSVNGTAGVSNFASRDDHMHPAPIWVSWIPTLSNGSAGNGTWFAEYFEFGKRVDFYIKFTLGTTSTITGVPIMTIPINAANASAFSSLRATFTDNGSTTYEVAPYPNGVTGVQMYLKTGTYAAFSGVGPTVPFVWTAGDFIEVGGTYRRI